MPDANGNGVRWRDIERLDQQDRVLQEGQRWLSEMGSKHNEQINELKDAVRGMRGDVAVSKSESALALERSTKAQDDVKGIKAALYTAGGGATLLAVSVFLNGGPG